MNVRLDSSDERELEQLARAGGKEPGEFLRELVRGAIAERKRQCGDRDDEIEDQARAWDAFLADLDRIPVAAPPANGLCASRDHDRILYGRRS